MRKVAQETGARECRAVLVRGSCEQDASERERMSEKGTCVVVNVNGGGVAKRVHRDDNTTAVVTADVGGRRALPPGGVWDQAGRGCTINNQGGTTSVFYDKVMTEPSQDSCVFCLWR